MEILCWTGVVLVLYTYIGYGMVLYILVRLKHLFNTEKPTLERADLPDVAFVVCALNEEDYIEEKIVNSLSLDYPKHRIHYWWVTDGSSDRTPEIIRNYPYAENTNWSLLHQPERRGKIAAFQRAMEQIQAPIIVSTDANTALNSAAIQKMVRHFQDLKIGAVAGEKRIALGETANASSAGEGFYWKYESLLKRWDDALCSVVGAAGELFAFRRAAYEHVPLDTIIEDFYLTLRIAQKGWKVSYEPDAYAVETASASVSEELKRKIRIAAGGLQAIVRLAPLLNIFRYGWLSFQYISHRVLRWTLAPLALPIVLLSSSILAAQGKCIYQLLLVAQLLFYAAAFAGYILAKRSIKVKALFIPYYFCMMNYAVYAGFKRYIMGSQSVLWEKAARAKMT
jgi:cellulose synthase/poly-beta-1,6-N-acetylglucosamine synthase-like glycosyltransferase